MRKEFFSFKEIFSSLGLLLLGVAMINCNNLYSQNVVGGVSISEDTLPPHPSSILDVRSINKGVGFPVLSVEQRDSLSIIATLKGVSMPNGLLVYVNRVGDTNSGYIERDVRGFWFWDANSSPNWQQLKESKMVYPEGSIIMHSGDLSGFDADGRGLPGTDNEGWAICNGKHGTPDLSGMFVKGVDFNTLSELGSRGGDNSVVLTKDNMVTHDHEVDSLNIDKINVGNHTHEVDEQGGHDHHYQIMERKKRTDRNEQLLGRRKSKRKKAAEKAVEFNKKSSLEGLE